MHFFPDEDTLAEVVSSEYGKDVSQIGPEDNETLIVTLAAIGWLKSCCPVHPTAISAWIRDRWVHHHSVHQFSTYVHVKLTARNLRFYQKIDKIRISLFELKTKFTSVFFFQIYLIDEYAWKWQNVKTNRARVVCVVGTVYSGVFATAKCQHKYFYLSHSYSYASRIRTFRIVHTLIGWSTAETTTTTAKKNLSVAKSNAPQCYIH